ncbi:uncharacterized protein [Arachis hypogaea]|uniref:uncharacterized protein isoform X2 n=1 Tax=Arachis hypogaea TaxID=3818 RepID=UPI000DED1DC2|nr:uncharacterized protein LOC112705610 isoform X2 [Arachis hypogaea]
MKGEGSREKGRRGKRGKLRWWASLPPSPPCAVKREIRESECRVEGAKKLRRTAAAPRSPPLSHHRQILEGHYATESPPLNRPRATIEQQNREERVLKEKEGASSATIAASSHCRLLRRRSWRWVAEPLPPENATITVEIHFIVVRVWSPLPLEVAAGATTKPVQRPPLLRFRITVNTYVSKTPCRAGM